MTQFRTHQQMAEVYQKRHEKGEQGPYILELDNSGQMLIFFGVSHSNDPEDKQWSVLDTKWQSFIEHDNHSKVLIIERQDTNPNGLTREEALQKYSESGLAAWSANESGVQTESGEPDRVDEIEYLKERFSVAEIMTYYFGRQMLQWYTQDKRVSPDWVDYASETIRLYSSLECWNDEQLNLGKTLTWFKQQTGKDFDSDDRSTLYALSDPSQSVVSSASGSFRDRHLFQKIQSKWHDGYDVFIVYGSGHAIVLEPALKELIRQTPFLS